MHRDLAMATRGAKAASGKEFAISLVATETSPAAKGTSRDAKAISRDARLTGLVAKVTSRANEMRIGLRFVERAMAARQAVAKLPRYARSPALKTSVLR